MVPLLLVQELIKGLFGEDVLELLVGLGHYVVRATLHHITIIPFQGCYWEDGTKVPLFRGSANDDVNHNNIDTLQYKFSGVRHDGP